MRSSLDEAAEGGTSDDRTAKARIRDAAIACIAADGVSDTTARKVAAAAGVSPGLVMHHFDSMEGLRAACDQYVVTVIREQKEKAAAEGPGIDVLAALRANDVGPLPAYLARVLTEDSPAVEQLIDDLVADAERYQQQFVDAGMLRPSHRPRERAAVLALWGLGALVLHRHAERLLGVDLADPGFGGESAASYLGPAYEILGRGILTEDFAANVIPSLLGTASEPPDPSPSSKGT